MRISDWSSDVCSSDLFIEPAAVVDQSALPSEITQYYGPASQPFNQDVYFAKLSFTADESNLFELTARQRDETGILDVGNSVRVPSAATALVNDETRVDLRYQFSSTNWLNDAHITYEKSAYNPTPVTASPGLRYTVIEPRSEEHTSELQSLKRISYAVFCLTQK